MNTKNNIHSCGDAWTGVRVGTPRPARVFLTLALLMSATLNVVLGTQFIVSLLANGEVPEASISPSGISEIITASVKELARKDAEILSRLVNANESMFLPAQAAYYKSLVRVTSIIGQPHLGKEELRAALDNARQKQVRRDEIVLEIFVEALHRFSPDARRQIAGYFSLH